MTHARRAAYLRALGAEVSTRSRDIAQMWPRESGVLHAVARGAAAGARHTFEYYADLVGTFPWEVPHRPARGGFGLVVKEPAGVGGAIIPWNAPMGLISMKLAPARSSGASGSLPARPPGSRSAARPPRSPSARHAAVCGQLLAGAPVGEETSRFPGGDLGPGAVAAYQQLEAVYA